MASSGAPVYYVNSYSPYGGRILYIRAKIVEMLMEGLEKAAPIIARLRRLYAQRGVAAAVWTVVAVFIIKRVISMIVASRRRARKIEDGEEGPLLTPTASAQRLASPSAVGRSTTPRRAKYGPVETQFDRLLDRFASEHEIGNDDECNQKQSP